MDIIAHTVFGFITGYSTKIIFPQTNKYSFTIGIACALLSTIPDIVGEIKAKKDNYKWYDKIHHFKHWLSFIPPITLHILMDIFVHGKNKRWYAYNHWTDFFFPSKYKERMWIETLTWIINLICIIIIIKS